MSAKLNYEGMESMLDSKVLTNNVDRSEWIFLFNCDTIDAVRTVLRGKPDAKVAVLNFADFRHPGVELLEGSADQEASLCMRTSLLSHLKQDFYPLQKKDVIYSPGVRVFSLVPTLNLGQIFHVDVISCAAPQNPQTEEREEGGRKELFYATEEDQSLMQHKIEAILRLAATKKCNTVILGAFGCGANKNPTSEVARIMRRVLLSADWKSVGIKKVLIAIDDRENGRPTWNAFTRVFEGCQGACIDLSGLMSLEMAHGFMKF